VPSSPTPPCAIQTYSGRYVVLAGLFVTCLIAANILAVKLLLLPGGLVVPAGIIIFPLSYLFGDVLTEVWGYAAARRVIWLGFACNLVAVTAFIIGGRLTAPTYWTGQSAYDRVLGQTPAILTASFCAYLVGEFLNAFVLAKLKIQTQGRWLWTRTIGSTLIGEGADSIVFILLAFALFHVAGVLTPGAIVTAILAQWGIKVAYEVVATPFTYIVVNYLKRSEGVDYYDVSTNFSPVIIARAAQKPASVQQAG
jgi:queuosine precursor transporter